jgi:cobalt-zinc-cadmium efflux system outer membrane protein
MSLSMRGGLRLAAASTVAILAALASGSSAAADPAPSFRELLTQAQTAAPQLAEAAGEVRQAEGLAQQARARPNPTLGLDVENFSGSGPYKGSSEAESTLSFGQALELGGKRSARVAAGRAGLDAARAQFNLARADYAFALAEAYAEAEAAERQVTLAQEGLSLTEEVLRISQALVDAGREAELRSLQARSAVTGARAALEAAQAARAGAFARLTALAGSPAPFTSLGESLLTKAAAAARNVDLLTTPAVIAAEAEREAAARRVRVERTRAVPDVTLSAGVRRFSADDSTALVAGISVPIPVFDQNRGNITAAQGELLSAEARLARARLDAQAELRTALFQVDAAQTRVSAAVETEQTAQEAYQLTRVAYEAGKAPLLELINARRSLAEARTQTIEAQLARLRAEAGLARLQGRPLGDL